MALSLRSRDSFTGGDTASLVGRTPDGAGVPALAIGTWQAYGAIPGTGFSETIGIESGVARILFTGEPTGYQNIPLLVSGQPAKGYRAEAIVLFPLGTSDGGYGEVAVSHQAGEETAYTFQVDGGGADDISWILYEVKTVAGVTNYTRLADPSPDSIPVAQGNPVTFSLELTPADVLIGVIDGVTVVTFDLTTDNAIDTGVPRPSILAAGLPALDIGDSADDSTPPGVAVLQFSVYFGACAAGTGTEASETLLARDDWTGGDDADIDARALDGGTGTWEKHPEYPATGDAIAIESGAAVSVDFDFKLYTVDGLPAPVGALAVESVVIYPQLDTPTGSTTGPYCRQDAELTGTSSGTNPDTGNLFHNGADVTFVDSWTVWFLRPPNSTSITAETTVSADAYTDGVGVFVPAEDIFVKLFYEKDSGGVSQVFITITHEASNPYKNILDRNRALVGTQDAVSFGFIEHDYCNYLHFSVWTDDLGTRFIAKWNNGSAGGASNVSGMAAPSYASSGVTLYGNQADSPTGGEAFEFADHTLGLRFDPVDDTGYYAVILFQHFDVVPEFYIELFAIVAGVKKRLISNDANPVGIPAEHDRLYTWRLTQVGNVLSLALDGTEMLTFDLATDTTESPVGAAPLITDTGRPALGADGTDATQMRITQFSVYDLVDAVPCNPCVPGGGGGGTGGPGGGADLAFLWRRKNGAWREAPTPSDTTTAFQSHHKGASRVPLRGWRYTNGAWRGMGFETTFVLDPTLNPPGTAAPPCEGVIDPLPTPNPAPPGTRGMALYNLWQSILTEYPPFNISIAGSSVAGLSGFLAALASADMLIWLVPVYRNEQTSGSGNTGPYDHTANQAKIAAFAGIDSDPNFDRISGLIVYDDLDAPGAWAGRPPNNTEIEEGCALASSIFGGKPAGVRATPRQLQQRGLTGAGAIRFSVAQFGGPGGYGSPTDYVDYADFHFTIASGLGLDGVIPGINPYRALRDGWRTSVWTDAFLEEVGVYFAGFGGAMNYGFEMWTGYPPSKRLLLPGTNLALQAIAAAL